MLWNSASKGTESIPLNSNVILIGLEKSCFPSAFIYILSFDRLIGSTGSKNSSKLFLMLKLN